VFYVTPDLAEAVLGERPDAEFLPNPIDSGRFAPTSKASESRKVLIVCALDDIKGAGRLLEAARRLASARPDISITALGGGLHEDAFAALSNVVVLPRQPRERLPAIINEHGVVMGQALLGVAGMAEYEAMACARPVVSWFSFGRAYPEPPPFVRALDGLDIAGAVERLVDDPEARLRLGAEGRQWVMKYHSMDAAVERVERAAEDMLRAGPGLLGSAAAGAS
jgi:glycosyltransferase involved in cell wall biosynthesis